MRGKSLGVALGLCGAFTVWPLLLWLMAQFNILGDRWFAALESLPYTFPIALAAAAVVLVVHGLVLNSQLAETLEEQYASAPVLPADARVPVGATATASGTVATATAPRTATAAPAADDETVELAVEPEAEGEEKPALGGKMAVAPRPKGFKGEAKEDKKSKKMKKVGRQVKNRAGYKAKNAVARGIRERLGLRF